MPIAIINEFTIALFFHVIAVVVAFGPTFAYPIFISFAEKHAPASLPSVYRSMTTIDRFLVTPGMIVILIAGIYLSAKLKLSGESWVMFGYLAIVALFGMTHAFFAPRYRKAIQITERDLEKGAGLSAEYQSLSRQMATGGMIASLIIIATVFLMIVRP